MDELIGRQPELARVDAALGRREALPAGLLFHGVAGIGKTSLWDEALRRAAQRGFRILRCSLTRHESRIAFAGLQDLVGPVLHEVLPALAPKQARALASALARDDDGGAPADEGAVAFALHAALVRLAAGAQIAVAVDDVQWLDDSSALLLGYAFRRLHDEPVLLVVAHRDGEASERAVSVTNGSGIAFERIEVGPLPLGAIHRLVRTRLGASLTRPQLLRVYGACDGNPLHALELARAIGPGGKSHDDGLADLLASRISALPDATRHAVALAALASDADVDVLRAAHGATLEQDLGPAVVADLVRLTGDQVRFVHPLIATAAEAGVSARSRAMMHERLAQVARSPEVRAAHLASAVDEPDADVADALEAAARSTRRRGARAASATLYEGAARLTPGDQVVARDRRRLAAAEAWYEAGDAERAESILASLLGTLPHGEQRCEAAWRLGILRDEAGHWRAAIDLWREALADEPGAGLRSRILGSLAVTAFYTGSVEEARHLAASGVEAAETSADPAQLARALSVQAMTVAMSGGSGWRELIDRALALEAKTDEALGDWSPAAVAAECARHTGDVATAVVHYAGVLERASAAGDANQEQWAAFGLATALLWTGDFRRASELADVVLDIADQTGHMRIAAKSLRAHADAYLGDLDVARSNVLAAIEAATAVDEATHLFGANVVLAVVEASAGHDAAALEAYARAHRIAVDVGLAHATALRLFLQEAEAAGIANLPDRADEALAAFDTATGGIAPGWAEPYLLRARAARLGALGDLAGATRALDDALASGALLPFERARTLLAAGMVARRRRELARARDCLTQAVAAFEALETPTWVERAKGELARVPGRRASSSAMLTESEAQVARLVAEGRSNREVAANLFVSVKTVEVTLTRVYAKVGVRSRAELAHRYGATAKQ